MLHVRSIMQITASSAQQSVLRIQSALSILTAVNLNLLHYPEQICIFDGQAYDYIIVGGGTAGCVLANRLVDNNTKILLIEAGGNPQIESESSGLMLYATEESNTWPYSINDSGLGRDTHKSVRNGMALGKLFGGSSSTGYVTYGQGNKNDYNDWAKIVNDSTWKWDSVLPYFKKSERLEDAHIRKTDGKFYGEYGNIGLNVQSTIDTNPYLEAFREYGNPVVPSLNGNRSIGYSNGLDTISNNLRQSTVISYLEPKLNNPNLYVLKNSTVTKILFDACKNAVGVEVYNCGRHIHVKAKIEVILSAGVVNSPKLLMLSGIGPKKQLCKHKIHTISNLPVGKGLQDHIGVTIIANLTNKILPFRPHDPLSYPAGFLVGFVALNKSIAYPNYQAAVYINQPSFLMKFCTFTYHYTDVICNNLIETNINSLMMYSILKKQKIVSRGRVMLKSNNYKDSPLINMDINKDDLDELATCLHDFLKIQDTKMFKKFGGIFKDPKLPECGKFDAHNIEYLKCYVRYMTASQHEYSSTCPMGRVVDSRLRVYGVKKLRVVDASVMIYPTAGGTLGPTIMIAEKAADFIKEDRRKVEKCHQNY